MTDLHLSMLIMMVITFRDVSKFASVNPANIATIGQRIVSCSKTKYHLALILKKRPLSTKSSKRYILYRDFPWQWHLCYKEITTLQRAEVNRQLKSHGIYGFYYSRNNQADYQSDVFNSTMLMCIIIWCTVISATRRLMFSLNTLL